MQDDESNSLLIERVEVQLGNGESLFLELRSFYRLSGYQCHFFFAWTQLVGGLQVKRVTEFKANALGIEGRVYFGFDYSVLIVSELHILFLVGTQVEYLHLGSTFTQSVEHYVGVEYIDVIQVHFWPQFQ